MTDAPRPVPAHWRHEACNRCGMPRAARDLEAMAEAARGHRGVCLAVRPVRTPDAGLPARTREGEKR